MLHKYVLKHNFATSKITNRKNDCIKLLDCYSSEEIHSKVLSFKVETTTKRKEEPVPIEATIT